MVTPKAYILVTVAVFVAVGLLHLLRVALGWEAIIGGWSVPMWLSWIAVAVMAGLAYLGLASSRRAD